MAEDSQLSVAILKDLVEKFPQDPAIRFDLALYLEAEDVDSAIQYYLETIQIQPANLDWEQAAIERFDSHRIVGRTLLQTVRALAHAKIAGLLAEKGTSEQNLEAYLGSIVYHGKCATELNPAEMTNHYTVGYVYMDLGLWDRAVEEFMCIKPDDFVSNYALARAFEKLNLTEEAIRHAYVSVKQYCEDEAARSFLVRLLKNQGRHEEASRIENEQTPLRNANAKLEWMRTTGAAIKALPDDLFAVLSRLLSHTFIVQKQGHALVHTRTRQSVAQVANSLGLSIQAVEHLKAEAFQVLKDKGIDTTELENAVAKSD